MKKMVRLFLCSILSSPCTAYSLSYGKKDSIPEEKLPVFYLGEIFVFAKALEHWVIPPSRVDRQLIRAERSLTVAEAIKMVEGLDVTVGSRNEARVMLRGFRPNQVMVLVDGRPVNNPYYGTTDLLSIPTNNVARIEVVKDVVSPLMTTGAMGGLVNIVTEEPGDRPYTELFLTFGSGNTRDLELRHGRSVEVSEDGRVYYAFGISRTTSDGYPLPRSFKPVGFDDGGLRDNSDYDRMNLHTKLGYRKGSAFNVGLTGGVYLSEKGIPPKEDGHARYWRFPDWDRRYLDLNATWRPSPLWKISGKFYLDRFFNRLVSYKDRSYSKDGIKSESTHDLWDYGTMVELGFIPNAHLETRAGFQFRGDMMNRRPDVGEEWIRNSLKTGNFSLSQSFEMGSLRGTASISFPFSVNDSSVFTMSLNPQVAVAWDVSSGFSIWASSGRLTRFPTGHELYSSTSGNPKLKPEYALKYQVGVEITRSPLVKMRVDLFYNDFRNLIDRPSRRELYRNFEEAYTAGGELSFNLRPVEMLTFMGSYTYTGGRDRTTNTTLPGIAHHKACLRAEVSTEMEGRLRVRCLYVSKRYCDDVVLDPYFVIDIFGEQRIGHLTVYGAITNLLDGLYEEEPYLPMPGRAFRGGVGVNF